ncbi:hypothetical protein ACFPM0_17480 [Pseudonocardia sulfidoxydans]|uniref:hypothetical protein n=1 Tax=Pseudonocardia sulfidoxydans TaxID=54011 RepID=UPI0036089250
MLFPERETALTSVSTPGGRGGDQERRTAPTRECGSAPFVMHLDQAACLVSQKILSIWAM